MADDAQWIDDAAQQQIKPPDAPSPDAQVTSDPGVMERLYKLLGPWKSDIPERYTSPRGGPPAGAGYMDRLRELGANYTRPGQPAMSREEYEAAVMRDMYARERKKNQRAPTQGGSR